MAPPAVAWRVFLTRMLVSDCSVGKFELQVGKKGSQVGKFECQVGKIALQVGIAIFWLPERRCHKQKRLLAAAKSIIKFFNKKKRRPKLYLRPPFFYIKRLCLAHGPHFWGQTDYSPFILPAPVSS